MNASNPQHPIQSLPPGTPPHRPGSQGGPRRLLITAGPTQEPIDAVRFLGNRSSGRLGIALAEAAAGRARSAHTARWRVTLLLGPTALSPTDPRVCVHRFRTTAELQRLLAEHVSACDVLVMAAAVADYTVQLPPRTGLLPPAGATKIRRGKEPITLTLVPTPDLLAGVAAAKRPDQLFVGFALEPEDRLLDSAREKRRRKGVDLIVANPLETMDAPTIRATLVSASAEIPLPPDGRPVPKEVFAELLLDVIDRHSATGIRHSVSTPDTDA